jgi:putative N6-adenine-specific DNA methylase
LRCFAVAAPGLEAVCAAELGAATTAGGAEFEADLERLYHANLWSRTATRILVRLGTIEARDFARLRRRAAELPWERFAGGRLDFAVTARRSRLYHGTAIAERLEGAVADRLGRAPAGEPPQRVVVRGEDDRFTLSLDSSGELLHRRGWRTEAGDAPLRETLAAGVLLLAGWRPDEALVDPTCGSGTFVIEAALAATGRAPGAGRAFAFQRWPGYDAALFARLVAEVRPHPAAAPIVGSDADASIVEVARRNAERAGVADAVELVAGPVAEARLPDGPPGLVVANPPYGRRLGAGAGLRDLYRAIARLARGWRLAILTGDARLLAACGRPRATHRLTNGGLPVTLATYG